MLFNPYKFPKANVIGLNESLSEKADLSVIAEEFDATVAYAVNDYTIYNGILYKCTTAHSGVWDANDFAATLVSDEFGSGSSVVPYTSNPEMDGIASAGSSNNYAKGDHVHPSDTSRVNKSGDTMTGSLNVWGDNTLVYEGTVESGKTLSVTNGNPLVIKINGVEVYSGTANVNRPVYLIKDGKVNCIPYGISKMIVDTFEDWTTRVYASTQTADLNVSGDIIDGSGNKLSDKPNTSDVVNNSVIADAFDYTRTSSNPYAIGDRVMKSDTLYRCIAPHYGAWDASHFEAETVADSLENDKEVIVTVPVSVWSSTATSGYYTATITTPEFSTEHPPKPTCAGSSLTAVATDAQMAAYRNIQNPNGYIEQLSSTSIKLYAKTKPTDEFYIKLKGRGVGTQIDSCQSATTANQVQSAFTLRTSAYNTYSYNGSTAREFGIYRWRQQILASGWGSTPNASGYYSSGSYFINRIVGSNYEVEIKPTGADASTRPTAAQYAAYRNICEPNGYVEYTTSSTGTTFTFYAKTKPTIDFYVILDFISVT